MADSHSSLLRHALREAVSSQLRDGTPPETRLTLDRLISEGYSREQALELIARVLGSEVFAVMNSRQPYDEARYLAGLRRLPRLLCEDDSDDDLLGRLFGQ